MDRKQMVKRIQAVTGGFRDGVITTTDDKATKLARTIKGKLGGVGSAAELAQAELLSELAGVDVVAAYNKLPATVANAENRFFQPLVCLVTTALYNGHTYPVNDPVVCIDVGYLTGAFRCVKKDGTIGNNLHNAPKGMLRLATDEEIAKLSDLQLDYFIKLYS